MNWFKYRLPNSSDVISGGSKRLIKGFAKGFVIAPFVNPKEGLVTIPYDISDPASKSEAAASDIPGTTSKIDFEEEIRFIINSLGNKRGKTVAARTIRIDLNIDLSATFNALCSAYPESFVFLFSTPNTGTWIGASPELLLGKDGDFISTMSLAGTRPSSGNHEEWDEKNSEEQMMVTEFIAACLMRHCGVVSVGRTYTKNAGPIEHICTPISAYMPITDLGEEYEESYNNRLKQILTDLSPTPAVCGSDRSFSLDQILGCEKFAREMYGGFCGPNGIEGTSAFFVNLRLAKVSRDAAAIYVGCGITPQSVPDSEWMETELKSKTIIHKLKTKKK